ncbi:cyclic nucleotide-binding domain-containing protein 1 [Garra rufa]|uniref:cyclic nucleotide-binding domain-containing protein 1 n=1 Tax=Garra rufa TaxID=137080 RepID=UPI003CCE7148
MRRYRHSDIDYTQLTRLNESINSEEAHEKFMKLYQEIFLRPQTSLPRIQLKTRIQPAVKLRVYESIQEVSRHQPHGKLAQESLMNHVIKALKKFPIERSQSEHHIIYKLLKGVHSLTSQLGSQELKQISAVTTVETWDRGQIIFGHNGFYLVLKGSVKPFNHETLKEDQTVSTISAGGSFGSCEAVNAVDGGAIIQCVMTLETCEILKISRSGYEKLKKDLLAQDHEVKVSLIQGCQLYLHWPKLSINHLVDGMQLKTFPANQEVKEKVEEAEAIEVIEKLEVEKKKILSDALFYNGVHPGRGKWTFNRGPRGGTGKSKKSL